MPSNSPQRAPGNFAWIAYNPKDGLFYSSKSDNADRLYQYAISGQIVYIGSVALTKVMQKVAGGAFSKNGRLYLASNDPATGAVNVVDLDPSHRNVGVVLGVGHLTWDPDDGEEIEGITVVDLDDGRAPNIRGQIHVIMFQNEIHSNDDFYFKHMRVSPLDKL